MHLLRTYYSQFRCPPGWSMSSSVGRHDGHDQGSDVVEVRFRSATDKAQCCDTAAANARFGAVLARLVALRLQQLAAMESVEEIVLIPAEVRRDGARWVVGVDSRTSLIVTLAEDAVPATLGHDEILVVEQVAVGARHS